MYGAAFEQGAKPDDTFVDQAVEIPLAGGEVWRPSDDGPPSGRAMSLRDGLVYSKNTITAQLMQSVGPAKVAKLARAMGVRQSRLDAVPSLALGTSPVTLKEMVSAYGTIANQGAYLEPVMVTRIEDRKGEVLETFRPASPEQALPVATVQTLLDVMRGVIDRGTGASIRTRFGIRADVAGKTGTTQDNADGWFILMHPQLVAGAWVGFNDSRVTLRSDYWGQGAHSALPMVGDFFQRSLRSRMIDANVRFVEHKETGLFEALGWTIRGWYQRWFGPAAKPEAPPAPKRVARPAPEAAAAEQESSVAASTAVPALQGVSGPAAEQGAVDAGSAPAPASSPAEVSASVPPAIAAPSFTQDDARVRTGESSQP